MQIRTEDSDRNYGQHLTILNRRRHSQQSLRIVNPKEIILNQGQETDPRYFHQEKAIYNQHVVQMCRKLNIPSQRLRFPDRYLVLVNRQQMSFLS